MVSRRAFTLTPTLTLALPLPSTPNQVSRRASCSQARSPGRHSRPLRRRRRRRGRGPALTLHTVTACLHTVIASITYGCRCGRGRASTSSCSAHRLRPSCKTTAGRPLHSARGWTMATPTPTPTPYPNPNPNPNPNQARGWTTVTPSATSSRSSPHPLAVARRVVARRLRLRPSRRPRWWQSTDSTAATADGAGCCSGAM